VDLLKFYSVKFNGFGTIEDTVHARGKYRKWIDFFEDIKPWAKTIKDRGLANIKSVEVLEKYWQKNSLRLKDVKKSYLVHGDFCLDHIFAFRGRYSGIIDFGDAFAGDPLMDLAYFKFKEITKTYGAKTFKLLRESLKKQRKVGQDKTILINLYMIYWALRRVIESNDPDMTKTFAKKLERLARDLETTA
jgi:aminoglycoside phosphotransferase (APT) family kinase protein